MQGGAGRHPNCAGAICETKPTFSHLTQTLEWRLVQRPNICNVEKNANNQIFKGLLDFLLLFWPPPVCEIDDAYVQAFMFWYTHANAIISPQSNKSAAAWMETSERTTFWNPKEHQFTNDGSFRVI